MEVAEVELSVPINVVVVTSVEDCVVDISILIVEEPSVDRIIADEAVVCDTE